MKEPGWLCTCGNWQDDDFHCEVCGEDPPWGCDCDACNVSRYDDDDDPFDDEDEEDFDDEEREDE
jgi:hypothetical protein